MEPPFLGVQPPFKIKKRETCRRARVRPHQRIVAILEFDCRPSLQACPILSTFPQSHGKGVGWVILTCPHLIFSDG